MMLWFYLAACVVTSTACATHYSSKNPESTFWSEVGVGACAFFWAPLVWIWAIFKSHQIAIGAMRHRLELPPGDIDDRLGHLGEPVVEVDVIAVRDGDSEYVRCPITGKLREVSRAP